MDVYAHVLIVRVTMRNWTGSSQPTDVLKCPNSLDRADSVQRWCKDLLLSSIFVSDGLLS